VIDTDLEDATNSGICDAISEIDGAGNLRCTDAFLGHPVTKPPWMRIGLGSD
jgi:hypothetical protein